jgi:hypothetical protein
VHVEITLVRVGITFVLVKISLRVEITHIMPPSPMDPCLLQIPQLLVKKHLDQTTKASSTLFSFTRPVIEEFCKLPFEKICKWDKTICRSLHFYAIFDIQTILLRSHSVVMFCLYFLIFVLAEFYQKPKKILKNIF